MLDLSLFHSCDVLQKHELYSFPLNKQDRSGILHDTVLKHKKSESSALQINLTFPLCLKNKWIGYKTWATFGRPWNKEVIKANYFCFKIVTRQDTMPLMDVCFCNLSAEAYKNMEEVLPYCELLRLLKHDFCIDVNQLNDLQIYTTSHQQAF